MSYHANVHRVRRFLVNELRDILRPCPGARVSYRRAIETIRRAWTIEGDFLYSQVDEALEELGIEIDGRDEIVDYYIP